MADTQIEFDLPSHDLYSYTRIAHTLPPTQPTPKNILALASGAILHLF